MSATESPDWFTSTLADGRKVVTNSYSAYSAGSRFVNTCSPTGALLGHWLSEDWASPTRSGEVMASIWASVATGEVDSDDYGVELSVPASGTELRCCPEGSYVRLLDRSGHELAYWCVDEWVTEPEFVMGSLLGMFGSG